MTIAFRISDILAKRTVEAGGKREGWTTKTMSLRGSFHGRTDRPAQASDSTLPKYRENLHSFTGRDNLVTVPPNDVAALEAAFAEAERSRVFIEALSLEPVMGEGDPGQAVSREVLRRRAPADPRPRQPPRRRLHPGRVPRLGVPVDPRLPGLRGLRRARRGVVEQGAQRRPVPVVGARAVGAGGEPLRPRGLRQHDDHEPARARRGRRRSSSGSRPRCATTSGTRGAELVSRLNELRREFPR
ncbi:MAG: hypothetical protein R3F59_06900 [Myxococcota bacterium]